MTHLRHLVVTSAMLALFSVSLQAQELVELAKAPLVPSASCVGDRAELGARFTLHLEFEVLVDLDRPYSILVELRSDGRSVLRRDHSPKRRTETWKEGETIRYDLDTLFPADARLGKSSEIEIAVAFRDLTLGKTLPPDGLPADGRGFAVCGRMKRPALPDLTTPEGIEAKLAEGKELARAGRKSAAFRCYEQGFRFCETEIEKRRFRDAILGLGPFEARVVNGVEDQIIAKRIADEKTRYLREVSGRLYDQGKLHGAIAILEEIGGTLEEAGGAAVIGALDDASRAQKGIQDARRAIVERISDADRDEGRRLRDSTPNDKALLDAAGKFFKKGQLPLARFLARELRFTDSEDLRRDSYRLLEEVEKTMLEAMPAEEQREVDAAIHHPAWARLKTRVSENFIYIGPERLIDGIVDHSMLHFDLAYVILTDLFGRRPNPEGDRVTVFFKELWDFGGATGGGKEINVGRADPDTRKHRMDTALFYHELTHCIDDTTPTLDGWREGLADFGAACALELVGQVSEAVAARKRYREAFKADYLDRDLEYWRIQDYAPSAGFFCHFVETYCKEGRDLHDWMPYRRFFRALRESEPKDGRIPGVIREVARLYMSLFDPKSFDDLRSFRLPLTPEDRQSLLAEETAYARNDFEVFEDIEAFEKHPGSPLPRDLGFRKLLAAHERRRPRAEILKMAEEDFGLIVSWQVIGPFKSPGGDPDAVIFPPEFEVDFSKVYRSAENECRWNTPERDSSVTLEDWGWLRFDYNYQDDAAIYALSHVHVREAMEGFIHLRADDDVTAFVNDRLVGKFRHSGMNGSTTGDWRGPRALVPDAQRFPIKLEKGRNKILIKIKNRHGPSGVACAISKSNGERPVFMSSDAEAPDQVKRKIAEQKGSMKRVFRQVFDSKSFGAKFEVTAGRFQVRRKRLVGIDRDGGVQWRKYTVRPGFPRDAPSNLIWLREKFSRDLDDFKLVMELEVDGGRSPKLGIQFQAEGGSDGLSGITALVHPGGDGVMGRLERYDRLVYQALGQKLPPLGEKEETRTLELIHDAGRVTLTLDGVTIFDACDMRSIENRNRLGFMTWNDDTRIVALELWRR